MMKFDDVDICIIYFLHDNPSQTCTDIAKKIFDAKEQKNVHKYDTLVRLRASKLVGKKILLRSLTTPRKYSINPEFVCCGTGVLNINVNDGKPMEIDFGNFLVITDTSEFIYLRRISKDGNNNMPKIIT